MKEFSEDEKTIAMNIDKKYKWMARDYDGSLWIFVNKPNKVRSNWYESSIEANLFRAFNYMFKSIKWEDNEPTLIEYIYNPRILNDTEREYLKAVLRPFHNRVVYVVKANSEEDMEFINIVSNDDYATPYKFPSFKKGEKYVGMKIGHPYSLSELGITYTDDE